MRKFSKLILLAVVLMSYTGLVNAQNKESIMQDREKMLAPFPKAEQGHMRYVIYLEPQENESEYKVEIVTGKVMSVDCNRHTLMGNLKEENLQGWGYTYYNFTSDGQASSTMMACNTPNQDKFVQGPTLLMRYNSRLPIVVFAPEGFEIKYKIWKAGDLESSPIL